ncbi:MAG: GIY-YIG nuclease family protein [Bacteroidetes bacterium]|nr:GIY-YIG nuclease family protein [Bacteroidota bacterium]
MKNIELKSIPIEKAEFCIIDFETTGLSPQNNRVIEIGAVKVKNLRIQDTYQTFINPGTQIPIYISELTGITDYHVQDAPYFADQIDHFRNFIDENIIVAHNLNFDLSFMQNEFYLAETEMPPNPALCTLKIARRYLPELRGKSLKNLTRHFRIRHKDVHRGLGDALVTAKLLIRMAKRLKDEQNIDTVADLLEYQKSTRKFTITKKKLADDYDNVPDSPGIYFFKTTQDKIQYIGKAKSLRKRVNNYFASAPARKTKKIVTKSSRLSFQVTGSELTALIGEAELIKKHKPPLNTLLKKFSQNYFIRVEGKTDFPTLKSTGTFDFDGNDYFGPYNNRDSSNLLIEVIDKSFKLRECTEKEFKKGKKCYLLDIERCLAPCIDTNIEESYKSELEKVYEFLAGNNQIVVNRLLEKMAWLAARKKYEEAGSIRDTVNLLMNQLNKLSILSEPINTSKVVIQVGKEKILDMILMIEGKVFIRNYFLDDNDYFTQALEDYFAGTINISPGAEEKDLERAKITLNWLLKNRTSVKLYYLKNYNSITEFYKALKFIK